MERPKPRQALKADKLQVEIYPSREAMGRASAHDVAARMRKRLEGGQTVRMVFAAAPSQNEFLAELRVAKGIDWARVEAFHMDEYIGLPVDAPQSFGRFLRLALFDHVRPGRIEYIDATAADPKAECSRYTALLGERQVDIVCAGIGENGHLAFNDPPVVDFDDPLSVKTVTLDEVCRAQQVHDGAFPTVADVPKTAMTLTVPALMSARWLYCMVPGPTKSEAVRRTLRERISTACPAGILRRHDGAVLYLDEASAAGL